MDVEILLLRRQLAIDARQQDQPMRLARGEELTPVVVATEPEAKAGLWGPKSRSAADSSVNRLAGSHGADSQVPDIQRSVMAIAYLRSECLPVDQEYVGQSLDADARG